MKSIIIQPISREDLSAILLAAQNQLKTWANECDDNDVKNYWLSKVQTIKKITNYLKDNYQDTYYLYDEIFKFH